MPIARCRATARLGRVPRSKPVGSAPRGPRPLGVSVYPGSVREAREAAGLSLQQLGGTALSRSAISVVEQGLSKPSLRSLRWIADRTGRRLADFAPDDEILRVQGISRAEIDLSISTLERLYELDRYSEALEKAEELLPTVEGLDAEFDVRYWIARATYMTGDTDRAIEQADLCASYFEAIGEQVRWAEALDCKGCAQIVAQDERAVDSFRKALDVLASVKPDPFDVRSRVLAHLGNAYVEAHDFDGAVRTLESAVREARGLRDLGRIGGMYEDLAFSYMELGAPARALGYANKAVAMHRRRQDWLALANAENNLGYVLLRRGELKSARTHVKASLQLYEEVGVERRKAHALLSLAEIDLGEGNLDKAEKGIEAAAELARRLDEKPNLAVAWQLLGRTAEARGDRRGADNQYRASIRLLEELGAKDRLADSYQEYGKVLEARGDDKGALRFMKAAFDASRGTTPRQEREVKTGSATG